MASTIKVDNVQNQPGTNVVNKCGTTVNIGAASDNIRSAGNNLQASDGGNLISQSGTDITLGASGDTINLASGASQSGFGRTGTVDWITTPKVTGDSPITGVTGKGYFLNTTGGTITLNLPAGAAGSIVSMADYAATWQTNNVTVAPNGAEKIGGLAQNATLSTEGQSVTFVYVDGTQGWINTMDSTSNVRGLVPYVVATGGTPCAGQTSGDYKYHTFTGPGTFCVSTVSGCVARNVVSYMVIAGAGGGASCIGGGGGAGGFREYKNSCDPYTASPLNGNPGGTAITVTASPYAITVGGGGTGGTGGVHCTSSKGANSVFSTITSAGGGTWHPTCNGGSPTTNIGGGSGSGSGHQGSVGCNGNLPPTTPSQGFPGGGGNSGYAGSGGGGAGAAGGNAPLASPSSPAGVGGNGVTTSINATPTARAGGGGGGTFVVCGPGAGGSGGGGAGAPIPGVGTAGTVNTGGGGGGGTHSPGPGPGQGGGGGSGIVIIRYKFQ